MQREVKPALLVSSIDDIGPLGGLVIPLPFLWTMGRYDLVLVVDAPNDETMSRLALGLGMLGNAKTETLKAFSAQEMDQILKGLP